MAAYSPKASLVRLFVVVGMLVVAAGSWFAFRVTGDSDDRDAVARESQGDSIGAPDDHSAPAMPAAPAQSASSKSSDVTSRTLPGLTGQAAAGTNQAGSATQASLPLTATLDSNSNGKAGEGPENTRMPLHWKACYPSANPANGGYLFASDESAAWSGTYSASISSRVAQPNPAGAAFCQTISAARLKGQRVEYSVHLRTSDAAPGAHIVFRAERADGRVVAFYNMAERWIRGTTDWNRASVVIDVPDDAAVIFVGATLVGTGTLWIDDAELTSAASGTALTQRPLPANFYNVVVDTSSLATELRNPGFEDTRARRTDER